MTPMTLDTPTPATTATTPTPALRALASRTRLADAVAAVSQAVPNKATLPVLTNILLEVTEESQGPMLTLTGTTLDLTIRRRIPLEQGTPGALTVPAKKLGELLANLPEGEVLLAGTATRLTVTAKKATVKLNALPAEEFPTMSLTGTTPLGTLKALTLHLLTSQVAFAVSTEESRPILGGVLLEATADRVRAVATNGHRLALAETPVTLTGATAETELALIATPAMLAALQRVIPGDNEVAVAYSANQLVVTGPDVIVAGRLIEGPYPNYRQVIPKDAVRTATADRLALLSTVRRIAVMASDQTHRVRLGFRGDAQILMVTTNSPDLGEAGDEIPVALGGEALDVDIGMNASYLTELLKSLPGDAVTMRSNGPERAVVIEPVTLPPTLLACLTLIMPLRLMD